MKPMFTVLTRTSGRPHFFEQCRRSVLMQQEPVFHLVHSDNLADDYPEGDLVLRRQRPATAGTRHENLYFNEMLRYVPESHPWVIYLDDDDVFTRPDALRIIRRAIMERYTAGPCLVLWKMRRLDHTIPDRVGEPPRFGNITGGAMCHHVADYVPWKNVHGGDYHVIRHLYDHVPHIWVDEVLTAMQAGPGMGRRQDMKKPRTQSAYRAAK